MYRTVIDIASGKVIQVQLTPKEIAELENRPKEPVPVRSIDARRLRLSLEQLGILDSIESAISLLDKPAQINWQSATYIRGDHPLVKQLATEFNLDINNIFELANSFE